MSKHKPGAGNKSGKPQGTTTKHPKVRELEAKLAKVEAERDKRKLVMNSHCSRCHYKNMCISTCVIAEIKALASPKPE